MTEPAPRKHKWFSTIVEGRSARIEAELEQIEQDGYEIFAILTNLENSGNYPYRIVARRPR